MAELGTPQGTAARYRDAVHQRKRKRINIDKKVLAFVEKIWYNAGATLLVYRKENYCEG
ncbi:hypothetical protein [Enterocloster citroniae]|uniref:hypothetical protein n=1 Tax=Enterocloster citroniae TaxID=358743 RepID=UPI00189B5461|nr:hypothetical protein [Enterocloster citroniae]